MHVEDDVTPASGYARFVGNTVMGRPPEHPPPLGAGNYTPLQPGRQYFRCSQLMRRHRLMDSSVPFMRARVDTTYTSDDSISLLHFDASLQHCRLRKVIDTRLLMRVPISSLVVTSR